ncbi:VOC family protein [candidate division WOR-3 bacterium]|nr:VOC family protein [candidate division WOR-3 bacterium]
MAGIVFFKTENMEKIKEFYIQTMEMEIWLEQKNCVILRHENMLIGFCKGKKPCKESLITFFYKGRNEIDAIHEKLKITAVNEPLFNKDYNIYHFYAKDPEERDIEIQCFCHCVDTEFFKSGF